MVFLLLFLFPILFFFCSNDFLFHILVSMLYFTLLLLCCLFPCTEFLQPSSLPNRVNFYVFISSLFFAALCVDDAWLLIRWCYDVKKKGNRLNVMEGLSLLPRMNLLVSFLHTHTSKLKKNKIFSFLLLRLASSLFIYHPMHSLMGSCQYKILTHSNLSSVYRLNDVSMCQSNRSDSFSF